MASGPRIELVEVSRAWGPHTALDRVSLVIEPGERVALVGPSGAGKTTLLRLVAGALRPSAGRVVVDGRDLDSLGTRALAAHRSRCGIVEQSQLLVRQLPVHHNVLAGLVSLWPWYRIAWSLIARTDQERVRAALAEVGLASRQWDGVAELSGGQQQRVAVARALIRRPDVVLADEPTASLDPATADEIASLLLAHSAARGATLLLSTHHLSQVHRRVDRIVGLKAGRVVLDAPPEDVQATSLAALYGLEA